MLLMKLATADVHAAELDQRRAIRCGKVEPDRVRIEHLELRPRFEAQKLSRPERLLYAGILVPIELDDRRIKGLAVMKLDSLAQGHLQGTVVDPAPAGSEAWDGFPPLFDIQEVLEDVIHHGDEVKAAA